MDYKVAERVPLKKKIKIKFDFKKTFNFRLNISDTKGQVFESPTVL